MSSEPQTAEWFPANLDAQKVTMCSHVLIEVARQFGFTREEYAASVAQLAEALAGHQNGDDIDAEVLRFAGERFRAVSDAISRSAN